MKAQSISRRNPRLDQIANTINAIVLTIKFICILVGTTFIASAFIIGSLFLIHGPTEFISRCNFILDTLAKYGYL